MNRIQLLLDILQEECSETAVRASKAMRFTPEEIQAGQKLTNAERIVYEFNDIYALMEMLQTEGVIGNFVNREMIEEKKKKVEEWYTYSVSCGTVEDAMLEKIEKLSEEIDYWKKEFDSAIESLKESNEFIELLKTQVNRRDNAPF